MDEIWRKLEAETAFKCLHFKSRVFEGVGFGLTPPPNKVIFEAQDEGGGRRREHLASHAGQAPRGRRLLSSVSGHRRRAFRETLSGRAAFYRRKTKGPPRPGASPPGRTAQEGGP